MTIALLTDSTCDLPPNSVRKMGIHTVPLKLNMKGKTWRDWEEVDPDVMYEELQTGGEVTFDAVEVETFEAKYQQLLKMHQTVLSLHVSGRLSQTVENAQKAVANLEEPHRVIVIDSELVSTLLAEVVLAAHEIIQDSGSVQDAVKKVNLIRNQMTAEFTVGNLDYLRRTGQLGPAKGFLGNVLGNWPIFQIIDGEPKIARRVKGDHAVREMLKQIYEDFGDEPISLTIAHAGRDQARVNGLRMVVDTAGLNVKRGRVQLIGSLFGAHVGPSTYGFVARPIRII